MPLKELLEHIIDTNDIRKSQIEKECNIMGTEICKGYIGKILSGEIKNPDDKKLEAIAKVLGLHEKMLVIENYIDHAPKEVKDLFKMFLSTSIYSGKSTFEDIIVINTLEDAGNIAKDIPISIMILELLKKGEKGLITDKKDISIVDTKENFIVKLSTTNSIPILDDSIRILPEGEEITYKCCEKYQNGDLIVFKLKNNETEYLIRYFIKNGEDILLKSTNTNYKTIVCKRKDITIIGKVDKLISNVQ